MAFFEVGLSNETTIRVTANSKFHARVVAEQRIGGRAISIRFVYMLPFISPMQRVTAGGVEYCAVK